MNAPRVNLLGFDRAGLEQYLAGFGEKPFRARILLRWIHKRGETRFEDMTDLSKSLRARLADEAEIRPPEVVERRDAGDGVSKWSVAVAGGNAVETVLIPDRGRNTLCISSQAGCALDCAFCATGKQGFDGNLTPAEIAGQVWLAVRELERRGDERGLTNVVFMGMGEPLLNFDASVAVANLLMDDLAYGLSKRRVTISTAGVVPKIRSLTDHTDCALAVSLHAADDALRDWLVPLNRRYPLAELIDACRAYLSHVGERRSVTFEYALMKGVNDSLSHAAALAGLLRNLRCKINLIPFNPFPDADFERPDASAITAFQTCLLNAGYTATLRATRGDEIAAACGQLTGAVRDRTNRRARYIARLRQPPVSAPAELPAR